MIIEVEGRLVCIRSKNQESCDFLGHNASRKVGKSFDFDWHEVSLGLPGSAYINQVSSSSLPFSVSQSAALRI